jgi:DNA processing protein
LIRDGGTLVTNVDDILELLGPISQPIPSRSRSSQSGTTTESPLNQADREIRHGLEATLSDLQRSVLDCISPTGTSIDEVISQTELPPAKVTSIVSMLEMKRLVRRLSSQYVSRV